MASVYVGDDELPNGSTALRLNLMALSRLLTRSPKTTSQSPPDRAQVGTWTGASA